jgi:hypothetical protein
MTGRVFVFGSNLAGRHGKGAALYARQHRGAIYGVGEGHQARYGADGPQCYAIPTKDGQLRRLPLEVIAGHVAAFLAFAANRPDLRFEVTPIGCGLAGFQPYQIAPLFAGAPANCDLPAEFLVVLNR